MYPGRKRRKPGQRGAKPLPTDGARSNPSKRHRERLNGEMERLASLLPFPQEVTSSLDKISILRLSVSYLRSKHLFSVALKNQPPDSLTSGHCDNCLHGNKNKVGVVDRSIPEGELLLQALRGFVLVITGEGIIFFSSHTIQDYLGFKQTDILYQRVFDLIHTDDQKHFRNNLHWAMNPPGGHTSEHTGPLSPSSTVTFDPERLPPENSSFLERSFICRFRCLLDNSSGFLAMGVQGRLKYLRGQDQRQGPRQATEPPRLALFAIVSPLQSPAILEIRTKNMIFRTKHKLDFTPMACDAKGKMVLGYTEAELRVRGSGYQFIHAADMLHCAENHMRMMKTGESGLTVFRLLTKENHWRWVQANARLVYKNGKPDYIIATQRPLVEEEGGEHLRKRSVHLPFTFATGEALLYQTGDPLQGFQHPHPAQGSGAKRGRPNGSSKDELDPGSLLGALMSQDQSVYVCQPATGPDLAVHGSLFNEPAGRGHGPGDPGWPPVGVDRQGSGYDPLLPTLESLSLDGEEMCSNSEFFGALEALGLDAEDLELLLLDSRRIQVEVDPDHLLTNNQILSHVQDAVLGNGVEGDGTGDGVGFTAPTWGQSSFPQGLQGPHLPGPLRPSSGLLPCQATPVLRLPMNPQPGESVSPQPRTDVHSNMLTGFQSHRWVEGDLVAHGNADNRRPQPIAGDSPLNRGHKPPSRLLGSNQQEPLQAQGNGQGTLPQDNRPSQGSLPQDNLPQGNLLCQDDRPWLASHNQVPVAASGAHLLNGRVDPFTGDRRVSHAGYAQPAWLTCPSNTSAADGAMTPEVCQYQDVMSHPQTYRFLQQTAARSPRLTQQHGQNSSLDPEQTVVLGQPAPSKLQDSSAARTSTVGYLGRCPLPNGNREEAGVIPGSPCSGPRPAESRILPQGGARL